MNYQNTLMWEEIFQQPNVIRQALAINAPKIQAIAKEARVRKIDHLVFVGRGSSEHACFIAKYVAEIHTPLHVSIVLPSIFTAYHGKVDYSKALVVGLSQSGGAKDVAQVIMSTKNQGALTVTLTNVRGSVLSDLGDHNLNNECGPELCVTATKSFMSQLIFLIALINAVSPSPELTRFLGGAADAADHALTLADQIKSFVPLFKKTDRLLIFGRGLSFAMGLEAELKIQETCTLDARCYATSDYVHGPIVTADPNVPVLAYLFDEATNDDTLALVNKLKHEKKVQVMVITDQPLIAEFHKGILIDAKHDALYGVIIGMMLSQMLACQLSIERGYDPDHPIGVTKNTVTF